MAAASDSESSSSSSSSSSSDEERSVAGAGGHDANIETAPAAEGGDAQDDDGGDAHQQHDGDVVDAHHQHDGDDDSRKAFLSRIPQTFDEAAVQRILEATFGAGCVADVSIVVERSDEDDGHAEKGAEEKEGATPAPLERHGKDSDATPHRGFGFVTFASPSHCQQAIEAGTARGAAKATGKRKHTLYLRPVVRDDGTEGHDGDAAGGNRNVCFLWRKGRCPYGNECKFVHEGEGGCISNERKNDEQSAKDKKKRQKCFAFKKGGKCKLGDECPYSHDVATKPNDAVDGSKHEEGKASADKQDKSQRDCINWKNKGKCRKGDGCPYRHDASLREKVLAKKKSKDGKESKRDKNRQSLSVRVFGLNYDTTESDMRAFFADCGPIMEITFPTFEDSGRSKGYCGVLFQSPKAVALAIELDGKELHGRWLRIQEGKMFLRKWGEAEKEREEKRKKHEEEEVGEYGQRVKRRKRHGFQD